MNNILKFKIYNGNTTIKKERTKEIINDFKSKLGFQQTKETSNADKPMEWLIMPDICIAFTWYSSKL